MLNRRQFLLRTLQGSSLLALSSVVPQFLARTAHAAEAGKETVLVVIEMTGGNDGLNTVIPYADDLYHKFRPTLRQTKDQVVKVDDHVGLNSGMRSLEPMIKNGQVAVIQGVGYPNPDRSHFESMDIWQSAEVGRKLSGTGWIARGAAGLHGKEGTIPVMQIGPEKLPLALQGASSAVVSVNDRQPFKLDLGSEPARHRTRKLMLEDLSKPAKGKEDEADLLQFVQRRQVQTYATIDKLRDLLGNLQDQGLPTNLQQRMFLISQLINQGFGARVFYVAIDGFDTHSGQAQPHAQLLQAVADSITFLFQSLQQTRNEGRVLVMTFSEFGRRVQENGSQGTDHGAASCMFVAGPGVKGGAITKHPSLADLDQGDLKHDTDFRRVYATLLDQWLGCDSRAILGEKFEHLDFIKAKA